jgi:hypothetical protein
VLFQLLNPELTPASLLEIESGFEIVTQFAKSDHLQIYNLCCQQ